MKTFATSHKKAVVQRAKFGGIKSDNIILCLMESVSNNISRLQQFLNEQNCIDKESIKEAKRIYWNTQKALWRQNQRKQNKAISLMLNKKEYAVISKQAKRHNLSVTKYSKLGNACLQ
jgi:hypothetical protein